MRLFCCSLFALMLLAGPASAQPVSYQVQTEVAQGKKPLLRIKAADKVSGLKIALTRDDGKTFTLTRGSLKKGQTATFRIGDGAAGRARYKGTVSGRSGGKRWKRQIEFSTRIRGKLRVTYDYDHLYLDRCRLEFKLSRPPASAELVVYGEDGKKLGTGSARYDSEPADKWVAIKWRQPRGKRVMKMRLRVVAKGGLETAVELIPWSVTVDHEEVNFSTGSAVIKRTEHGKLDASLAEIESIVKETGRFIKMKLYIAGHTDTVGSAASNRKLSRDRARAIARYFRKKGLEIPIAAAGFGEHVLAVDTPDDTDKAANRRVDYVLGPARGAPPFKGPYRKVEARWKNIR